MRTTRIFLGLGALGVAMFLAFAHTPPIQPEPQAHLTAPEDVAVYTLEIVNAPIN